MLRACAARARWRPRPRPTFVAQQRWLGAATAAKGGKAAKAVARPTRAQLWRLALVNGVPMIGFGFADNLIMIARRRRRRRARARARPRVVGRGRRRSRAT